jgi:hypothetical protein
MKLLFAIITTSTFFGCGNSSEEKSKTEITKGETTTKEASNDAVKGVAAATGDNTISFIIGGDDEVTLKADVMLNEINGKQTLTIGTVGVVTDGREVKQHLVIDWDEPDESSISFDEKGKYGHPKAVYHPDIMGNISNSYQFKSGGILDITSIDLRKGGHISGTFEGAAVNKKGELISISKGKINNAKIHGGVYTTK